MKIELTKEQLKNLVKLVTLGNLTANDFKDEDDRIRKFDELEALLLTEAGKAGLAALSEFCSCAKQHTVPSAVLLDDRDVGGCQEDYDDEVFWSELIERLAERDFRQHYGQRVIKGMSREERHEKFDAYRRRYEQEVEDHGVERLFVAIKKLSA